VISSLQAEDFVESREGARLRLTVRKAVMHDIPPILDLINSYAARGVMLPRTEFEMSEAIRDFTVILSGEKLLGCGALHFYSPTLAEIRSLAVSEQAKTLGVGRKLVGALVMEAQEYELDAAFAFTYVTEFFRKVGFHVVERGRTVCGAPSSWRAMRSPCCASFGPSDGTPKSGGWRLPTTSSFRFPRRRLNTPFHIHSLGCSDLLMSAGDFG
jgi:amino-acid N-acetyltransferase